MGKNKVIPVGAGSASNFAPWGSNCADSRRILGRDDGTVLVARLCAGNYILLIRVEGR